MESWPRVVVVGPGGVGTYFGGMLARAGAPVTMLGRSGGQSAHLVAMARNGLRLETLTFDERVPVDTATCADVVATADLVLFSVKTPDTDEAARMIAPHVSDRAVVVDLQNGVDNPARMRHAGIDPIVAVVYVAAAIETPGAVKHRGRGDLVIGHRSRASEVERVAAWFVRAGVSCQVSEDVERELWFKLILNSMTNAVSALTGASYGALAAFESTWQVAGDVAREGIAVARAAVTAAEQVEERDDDRARPRGLPRRRSGHLLDPAGHRARSPDRDRRAQRFHRPARNRAGDRDPDQPRALGARQVAGTARPAASPEANSRCRPR